MKANKFFDIALAALTLVSFNACNQNKPDDPEKEDTLALTPTSLQLEVDSAATITATVAAEWVSSDATVATVTPANDGGKSALVKALKEGSAVITATTKGGQTKTCVVAVKKGGQSGGAQLKGSQVWPIILDGTTLEANQSKVVASFQPNDDDKWLYIWEQTYSGGTATGLNFHGNGDGYTALVVGGAGWAGAGFCISTKDEAGNVKGEAWKDVEALRAAIVANPDEYFLHMAIKSTDNYSHCFYFMGVENGTKFGLGAAAVYDAPASTLKNFTRDGSWAEFDIPMSSFATALAGATCEAGVNVFVMLTEGVQGAQLNLDAVYFYKK